MLDYRWSHNPLTYRGTVTSNWYWSHTVPKVGSQSSRITDECHNTRLEGCLCYTPIGKDVIWEASPSIWGASLLHTNTWRRKKFPFCATIQIYKACSQFFFFFYLSSVIGIKLYLAFLLSKLGDDFAQMLLCWTGVTIFCEIFRMRIVSLVNSIWFIRQFNTENKKMTQDSGCSNYTNLHYLLQTLYLNDNISAMGWLI